MTSNNISTDRVLSKLDEYFAKNDYPGAERHLKYWFDEAVSLNDVKAEILICNELIGLSRKTQKKEQTFFYTDKALSILKAFDMEKTVVGATTYINVATAHKAFGKAVESIPYFEFARSVYEQELEPTDSRLGGLYNNFALTLVDVSRFDEAFELYGKALEVMKNAENGELECAITYLNIASAIEVQKGLLDGENEISEYLNKASELLDVHATSSDGYYAFVCEKCASVFGYYGHFMYEKELLERAHKIYERN